MTSASTRARVPATAPLLFWLLLVAGLGALTVLRIDALGRMSPLWVGCVAGAAVGQVFSRLRLRIWLSGFLALTLICVGASLASPLWGSIATSVRPAEIFIPAFVAAALSGYFSLTERGALVALWFPAVPWVLAILDQETGAALHGAASWLLLGGLAALALAFLRARETRRVALWRTSAASRVAAPGERVVLRASPLRAATQVGFLALVGGLTLALTGFLAPHLWQREPVASGPGRAAAGAAGGVAGLRGGSPCCGDRFSHTRRERVDECLPLTQAIDVDTEIDSLSSCVACRDGVPIGRGAGEVAIASELGASVDGHSTGTLPTTSETASPVAAAVADERGRNPAPQGPSPSPPVVDHGADPAPALARPAPTLAPTQTQVASRPLPAPPGAAPLAVARVDSADAHSSPLPVALPPSPPPAEDAASNAAPVHWAGLAVAAVALFIGVRALRRFLALRHLSRSIWSESVDQRVSNLWELMRVGLSDAGIREAPGEQPQELARRVGLEGMATCALVLERARHGVRVEAEDVAAMDGAAHAVYAFARKRAGLVARALSWLRWPLM